MIDVVSFSGGRTSAYLVHLMKERNPEAKFIFMDTGAEHPKTYEFVRNVVKHFGIDLVCLRVDINPELGKANSYRVVGLDEIGPDLQPWRAMLAKYGTPYNPGGAFCTDRMKLVPFTKYCQEHYGRGNYTTWLGIREDEPRRLNERQGIRYLAEISDFDKLDVLDWWRGQPFDLGIDEWLGNCVFCIKKGVNKVALAAKDEPRLADEFWSLLRESTVRTVESRTADPLQMYRGRSDFGQVIAMFAEVDRDELANSLRQAKRMDTGSCSESCEVFSGQMDLSLEG